MPDLPPIKGPSPAEPSQRDTVAKSADIREPPQVIRKEEAGAQLRGKKPPQVKGLPQSLAELAAIQKELEKRGHKVEKSGRALMEFLKHDGGEGLSEEALLATAAMMAELPMRRKKKKKSIHRLYLTWAREKSTVLITKVIHAFRGK